MDDDPQEDSGLPMVVDDPITEFLRSEDTALANAVARTALELDRNQAFAAHGSAPDPRTSTT